jgi:hypothetical protein
MRISHEVRAQARAAEGMAEMSARFRASGSELYVPVPSPAAGSTES